LTDLRYGHQRQLPGINTTCAFPGSVSDMSFSVLAIPPLFCEARSSNRYVTSQRDFSCALNGRMHQRRRLTQWLAGEGSGIVTHSQENKYHGVASQ
jgi:hypothetical protein